MSDPTPDNVVVLADWRRARPGKPGPAVSVFNLSDAEKDHLILAMLRKIGDTLEGRAR